LSAVRLEVFSISWQLLLMLKEYLSLVLLLVIPLIGLLKRGIDGQVYFTDLSKDNILLAKDFIKLVGFEERIHIHFGDGALILDGSSGEFDIIFNDIEKEDYPQVIDRAYKKLRTGGLFIADNVLWHGRVISEDKSPATEGVREFTKLLMSHKGFYTTIVPIRDGLSISVKL